MIAVFAVDLARPPDRQLSATALLAGIDWYQASLRERVTKLGTRCRFEPSCSRYAEVVIRRDGALVGGARATWRILRCGPWTAAGTVDVP